MKKYAFFCSILLAFSVTTCWAKDSLQLPKATNKVECLVKRINRGGKERNLTGNAHLKVRNGTSSNWSGYVAATNINRPKRNSISAISGAWTIPALSPTIGDAYSSIWVGIDGYTDGTVEQIGTEQDWSSGSQQNYAWFEMYPRGSFEIVGFPVDVGDQISASVQYLQNNQYELSIHNITKNVFSVIPVSKTTSRKAQRSSAEWVVEAPTSSSVLPLADFLNVTFTNCSATIGGVQGAINRTNPDKINMADQGGVVKAVTSDLTDSGTTFTVSWQHL